MEETLIQFSVKAIISYLAAHPGSADTVEGIHQWWIRWPDLPESIQVTAAALAQLEQAGLIERQRLGNREIWRRPRAKEV